MEEVLWGEQGSWQTEVKRSKRGGLVNLVAQCIDMLPNDGYQIEDLAVVDLFL